MLNRKALVAALAAETDATATDAGRFLDSLESVLIKALEDGDKVQLPGFLTVETVERKARTGRNPQTGEAMEIKAGKSVKLTAGSRLKAAVKTD